MRAKSNAPLYWAAILALGITLTSAPTEAQTVNKAAELEQLRSERGIPLPLGRTISPQRRSTPAKQPRMKLESPFDRVMAPMLAKMHQAGAKSSGAVKSARPEGTGVDGSNINFPGFVGVPFLTVDDGDGNTAFCSVSASFTNNGRIDVAQIKTDGTIDVILNPGTFANIASVTPLVSQTTNNQVYIANVIAADMNGDGYPDLVGMDIYNGAVVVWINNGKGSFGPPASYPVTLASSASWLTSGGSISVGDFNGTGAMSVVALTETPANPGGTVIAEVTFINDGAGQLLPLAEEDTTFADYYETVFGQAVVVTNDGTKASGIAFLLLDEGFTVPANRGFAIATLASNGDGTFKPAVEPATFLVQDAATSTDNSIVASNLSATAAASTSSTMNPPGTPGSGIATTDIVFMTGDGAVYDAPYTSGNPTVANTLVGNNDELYAFFVTYTPPVTNPPSPPSLLTYPIPNQVSLNVADMNGDGTLDLVVYGYGAVYVFPNSGKGVFTAAPTEMAGAFSGIQEPQPANYDGSSYNSLIDVDEYLSEIGFYRNLGAAASTQAGQFFAAPLTTGPNIGENIEVLGSNIQIIAAADVSGNGVPALIGLDNSNLNGTPLGNIVVGFQNGSGAGNQSSNYTFTTALAGFAYDFEFINPSVISNSSGVSILLGAGNTGPILLPLGKNGIAGIPVTLSLGIATDCSINYADVGDVNGDGILDIVMAYGGDGSCSGPDSVPSGFFTLLGNADGTYQPATFTALGRALYSIRLINFSGVPGNMDLAAIDYDGGVQSENTGVWVVPNKGDGSGTFNVGKATELEYSNVVTDIVPGDYNMDGKQDLTLLTAGQFNLSTYTVTPNTSGVLLLPGNGDCTFGAPQLINMPNVEPLWGAYADFNGDGTPDLALAVSYNEFVVREFQPMVQVLPNLGGGIFGPAVVEMNGFTAGFDTLVNARSEGAMYLLAGNFSKSGGPDMVVSSMYSTAEFVNQGVTALALTASSTAVEQGAPVTLTATASQVFGSGVSATGIITFSDNGTVLAIVEATNGVATLTMALPVGSDVITATYAGDALHNQATALPITVTVATLAPAFLLTASPATLTVAQGATGTVLASLAGNSTFNGAIAITCSGAPAETSCTASPANVMLSAGQSAAVSIVVATTPPNSTYQANGSSPKPPWMGPLSGLSLAGLVFVLWPRHRRRFSLLALIAAVTLALGATGALSGCSSSAPTYAGTKAGAYTLTVTATSGGLTQALPIALTVTQAQ